MDCIVFLSVFISKYQIWVNVQLFPNHFLFIILLTSITIILSSLPYCAEQIYYTIVSNNYDEVSSIVFLYHIIATILFYLNPVSSFYVYFISTPNFRRQIWKFLCWNKDEHHFNNQINVINVSK